MITTKRTRSTTSVYNIFLRRCTGQPCDFGNSSGLKNKLRQIKDMGFGSAMLMSINDPATFDKNSSDSPYSPLSSYGIDPRVIDVSRIPTRGSSIVEKFINFRNSRLLSVRLSRISRDRSAIEYADARAINTLLFPHAGYIYDMLQTLACPFDGRGLKVFNRGDLLKIRASQAYRIIYELSIFEQYFARKQMAEAVKYAHSIGLRMFFDVPAFQSVVGSTYISHPEELLTDNNGVPLCNGWHLGRPEQQVWPMLARYDNDFLEFSGYKPLMDVFKFWSGLGFDGFRGDAFHYFYDLPGYWEKVSDFCNRKGLTMFTETLGCDDPDSVPGKSRRLGNVNIYNPFLRPATANGLKDFISYANQHPNFVIAATHDTERVPSSFRSMFNGASDEKISTAIHTLFAMTSSWWGVFQDDEYSCDHIVQVPGIDSLWKGGCHEHSGQSIMEIFKRLNAIRARNSFISESGNISWRKTSYNSYNESGVIPFTRSSANGKRHVVTIVNLSGEVKEGRAYVGLGSLGKDISKKFVLRNSFNGETVEFVPGENVLPDGSVIYRLKPCEAYIFEVRT